MPFHSNVSFPTLTYRLHKTTLPKLLNRVNQKFISEAREGLFFIFRDKLKITRLRERETECTVENWGNNIMLKTFWWHHSCDRDLFTCQHFQVRGSAKFKAPYQMNNSKVQNSQRDHQRKTVNIYVWCTYNIFSCYSSHISSFRWAE